jgi:hypothetical protein
MVEYVHHCMCASEKYKYNYPGGEESRLTDPNGYNQKDPTGFSLQNILKENLTPLVLFPYHNKKNRM